MSHFKVDVMFFLLPFLLGSLWVTNITKKISLQKNGIWISSFLILLLSLMIFPKMADAAAINCAGEASNINRGCEGSQAVSYPFDFENPDDYCQPGSANRALFSICDCIPEIFETIAAGDVIDIQMEILVDSGNGPANGDNGVYWAEDVSLVGIPMATYPSQS